MYAETYEGLIKYVQRISISPCKNYSDIAKILLEKF